MTSHTTTLDQPPVRLKVEDLLLALAALAPAATVFAAFILRLAPEWVYPLGKGLMILVPTLWILIDRWSWREVIDRWALRFRLRDLFWALGTGLIVSLAILALYALFFHHRLDAQGIVSTLPAYLIDHFWLSALGVSVANSLLEEYFWRAFLLRAFIDWQNFERIPLGTFTWLSFLGTSAVSTLQHPDNWGVSILCWLVFNGVFYWTRSILCLVLLHGFTNLVLYLIVLRTGDWSFW